MADQKPAEDRPRRVLSWDQVRPSVRAEVERQITIYETDQRRRKARRLVQ